MRSGGKGGTFYDLRLPWPLQSNLQLPAEAHGMEAHMFPGQVLPWGC